MTERILLYALIGILVSSALAFLAKASTKTIAKDKKGLYILGMNKLYGLLGLIGLVFGALFLVFLPLTAERIDSETLGLTALMLLIFWGSGIPCLLYYKNHKLYFDSQSIVSINIYGKSKEIKWSDITDIRFKVFTGYLEFKTNENKLKAHQHLVGFSKLVEMLEHKTKWTHKGLKIPKGN